MDVRIRPHRRVAAVLDRDSAGEREVPLGQLAGTVVDEVGVGTLVPLMSSSDLGVYVS